MTGTELDPRAGTVRLEERPALPALSHIQRTSRERWQRKGREKVTGTELSPRAGTVRLEERPALPLSLSYPTHKQREMAAQRGGVRGLERRR